MVFGRQGPDTSYIGLGGRVGVGVFRFHGSNLWRQRGSEDFVATRAAGTEVGYMAQGVLELGSYFGRRRTVEFGGSVGVGTPLLSVAFHLGVSVNGG